MLSPEEIVIHPDREKSSASFVEFVIIISMMMSLTALSIDVMLPALPQIARDLGVAQPNDRQLVISLIFLGSALGQIFFGPLSDKTGRRPAIFIGFSMYIAGSLVSLFAQNLPVMLAGRVLQGLGLSAPRAVALALVRDRYEGPRMARILSFTMTVFILVPMVAPALGQGILLFAGWRSIFASFVLFALVIMSWFALRIPETLPLENRSQFSTKQILVTYRNIINIRSSLAFTLVSGLMYGYFLGYINSAQQILQEQYRLGGSFPLYFALIALSMGMAYLFNSQLVMRFGMIRLVRLAASIVFCFGAIFLVIAVLFAGQPPLWALMAFLTATFFTTGMVFGNINALAMQPLGRQAGAGSAIVGSLSTLLSMLLGMLVGRSYDGTILPLIIAITCLSGISIILIRWASSNPAPSAPLIQT